MVKAVSIMCLVFRIESTWLDSSHHGGKKQASTFGCPGYPSQTVHSCKRTFPDMTIYEPISNHIKIIKLATITVSEKFTDKTWFQRMSNWYVSFWHPHPPIGPWWSLLHPWHLSSAFGHRPIHRTLPDQSAQRRGVGYAYLLLVRGPRCLFRLNNKSLELLANSGNKNLDLYKCKYRDIWWLF